MSQISWFPGHMKKATRLIEEKKLMSEDDREDVYMSFQGKFINGKMKVGAVVRVLKPLSDDERAKTLRSVPIAQRETDAYRTRCRQKFWTLYFYEFHDTENLCNLEF